MKTLFLILLAALAGTAQAVDAPTAAAYGLVLTYVDNAAKTVITSAIFLYPTKEACEAAGVGIGNYQAGKEAALHPGTLVNYFCVAATAAPQ